MERTLDTRIWANYSVKHHLHTDSAEDKMTQQTKNRRYYLELGGAMFLYAIVLSAVLHYGQMLEHGVLQVAIYLCPMLPIGIAVWAIVRQIRRSDEFIRKTTLEHIAIAAAVTAVLTFTYGFLENAGLPRLSMFTVWPVMAGAWVIAGMASGLCRR